MIFLLLFILGIVLIIIGTILQSYVRAMSNPYTFEKHGMVFDTINKKIVGTTTLIHTDPKTGRQFFGKTKLK